MNHEFTREESSNWKRKLGMRQYLSNNYVLNYDSVKKKLQSVVKKTRNF